MTLLETIRHCFKNALDFKRRADRYEFWNFVLFLVLASIVLVILNSVIFGPTVSDSVQVQIDASGNQSVGVHRQISYNSGWLGTIFGFVIAVPMLAVSVRRLHDRDKSGWLVLTPIVGMAVAFGIMMLNTVTVPIDTTGLPPEFPTEAAVPANVALFFVAWLVAFVSFVLPIVWLARKGTQGPNRFGPRPNEVPS